MKRRMAILLLGLGTLLVLTGCGGPKPADEKQLQADVEAYEGYASWGAETKDLEVVKRQTNEDAGTDTVWVTVTGETESCTVTRSFQMEYELYNDGWMLEDIFPWENEQRPDAAAPLRGLTEEEAIAQIEGSYGLDEYAAFYGDNVNSTEVASVTHQGEMRQDGEDFYDDWSCELVYHYGVVDETVTLPVEFHFVVGSGYWAPSFSREEAVRTARLNDNLVGGWSDDQLDYFYGEVLEVDEDGMGCTIGGFWPLGDYYDLPFDEDKGGHASFTWNTDGGLCLAWDDVQGHELSTGQDGAGSGPFPLFNIRKGDVRWNAEPWDLGFMSMSRDD